MKSKKRKKGFIRNNLAGILAGMCYGVCGCFSAMMADDWNGLGPIGSLGVALLLFVAAVLLQVMIHEAGHLVFGLMSGYGFQSYRVFNLMLMNDDGRLKWKRFSLAGTAGQCLMSPPELENGTMPFVLYNLGGVILNLISAALAAAVWLLCAREGVGSLFFPQLALMGVCMAITNGIPMKTGMVNNDGYNAIALGKNPESLRAFWLQLKGNAEQAAGKTLKELPAEWFAMPTDEGLQDSMVVVQGVLHCNRLMEEHRFEETDRQLHALLAKDTAMVGIHRGLCINDQVFCRVVLGQERSAIDALLSKEQKKFMKSMGTFLAVVRTQYAYAKLVERDEKAAAKWKKAFQKAARNYPYAGDLATERGYLAVVDRLDG